MYRHTYLSQALRRRREGKPNHKDLYYMELFRIKKDFMNLPNTSTLTFSLFPYILSNYERTILNKEKFFTLYKECGTYPNLVFLLNCLKLLDIHCISFPEEISKLKFIKELEAEVSDGYFPVIVSDTEKVVFNAIEKKHSEALFGIIP